MRWRAPGAADLDDLLALIHGIEEADDYPGKTSRAQVQFDIGKVADADRDVVAGFLPNGSPVALGWIPASRGGTRKHRALMYAYVHPGYRDTVGDTLLGRLGRRATEILASLPDGLPRVIRCWTSATDRSMRELYERNGYEAVRFFSERRRRCDAPLPAASLPDGVALAPWDPALSETVRVVHAETFADHWGSEPLGPEAWDHHYANGPDVRIDLSFLARRGDEIAGYLLTEVYPEDEAVTGHAEAWVATLGVRPAWRRHGIASALLVAAIEAYGSEGFEYASLAVDAASETGALGLYDRLGFVEFYRTVNFVKEVHA